MDRVQVFAGISLGLLLACCTYLGYVIGSRECQEWLRDRPPVCRPPDFYFLTSFNGSTVVGKGWYDPEYARVCS